MFTSVVLACSVTLTAHELPVTQAFGKPSTVPDSDTPLLVEFTMPAERLTWEQITPASLKASPEDQTDLPIQRASH